MSFTLRILSHTITVHEIEPGPFADATQIGAADYAPAEIRILKGLHPDTFAHTLCHEIVHIIESVQGVKFEEHEVDAIATGFFSVLKDNPHFVETFINPLRNPLSTL